MVIVRMDLSCHRQHGEGAFWRWMYGEASMTEFPSMHGSILADPPRSQDLLVAKRTSKRYKQLTPANLLKLGGGEHLSVGQLLI